MEGNEARNVDISCAATWFYMLSGASVKGLSVSGASLSLQYDLVPIAGLLAVIWFYYRFRMSDSWSNFDHSQIYRNSGASKRMLRYLKKIIPDATSNHVTRVNVRGTNSLAVWLMRLASISRPEWGRKETN